MDCFIYSWNVINDIIYAFGKKKEGNSVLIKIPFHSYCYLLLPEYKSGVWTEHGVRLLVNYFKIVLGDKRPSTVVLCQKYRLYGAYLTENGVRKKFCFLKCFFRKKNSMYSFVKQFENVVTIPGLGSAKFKIFEDSSNPVLQLCTNLHLDTIGWVTVPNLIPSVTKESLCNEEYILQDWNKLKKNVDLQTIPSLTICSFDIECVPEDRTKFPNPIMPNDVCFQISCVIFGKEKPFEKFLLAIGKLNPIDDVTILEFVDERQLLKGFTDFLRQYSVNICIGYNIFQFDIPYLIERSKQNQCFEYFSKQGFLKDVVCKEKNIKWSSSAYQVQEYKFLENEGRIFVDLLPVIQKEYKLENYKLDTVSKHFLDQKKDDLTYEDVNRCFDENSPTSLSLCGKYCVQDSVLVANLFEKLQIFYSLYCMANVCRVPINTLLLYGQQIKVYSAIYQYCVDNNFVVEKPDYKCKIDERYTGAYVFEPVPGLYENVVPFDFASLYPTTIIAYNIDYSTIVLDDAIEGDFHVMEWEDHVNCIHDKSGKGKSTICQKRKYRFLKEPKGVLPTIISDLLEKRKETRNEMAKVSDPMMKLVLNQRQLAYKVSANSMYGITGVREGMLPLMPLAMCITFKGRENVILAAERIKTMFGGEIKYGDTDSNYIVFPHINIEHLYEFGSYVSREISCTFPDPIHLEFEDEVYSKFLIFTKKRYCYQKMEKSGIMSDKIGKKGILLCRRDTCKFIQKLYEGIIAIIFKNKNCELLFEEVKDYLTEHIEQLLTLQIPIENLVMTKSFNDFEGTAKNGRLGHYKVKMKENEDHDFYIKQLPALCQLADRLKQRGDFKFEGRRLEYVMLDTDNKKHKQGDKLEHIEYFLKHRQDLKLDLFYYFERIVEPIDQIIETVFFKKDWTKTFFKHHGKLKIKLLAQINKFSQPIITFQE